MTEKILDILEYITFITIMIYMCLLSPWWLSRAFSWNFFYFYPIWYIVGLQCQCVWITKYMTNPKYCGYIHPKCRKWDEVGNLEFWLCGFMGLWALPMTFPL